LALDGVKPPGPHLEGPHHAPHRLIEKRPDQALQEARAELEIDEELDGAAALGLGMEDPVVIEMAKGSGEIFNVDAVRSIEGHTRAEFLAKQLEANRDIGVQHATFALGDAGAFAPR
jgi:hypothetical protein